MAQEKKKKSKTDSPLQIYVGEDKVSIARTVNAQVALLALPTPEKYIMQRKGRGNLVLDYVETNYVIGRLNATFFFDWDSEILEQIIDKENNQIAIKIRLTVRFANKKEVKKDAWGGSEIKYMKESKKMVDLADDLKSAESDGIKKAASMLGICWDVYAGLTGTGKKANKKKTDKSNGFTDMPGPPDRANEFRTIPIKVGNKRVLHTKYEVLDRFKEAKTKLGEELYYKVLGENGYEKANQIPASDLQKLYDAMATAYKENKVPTIEEKKEEAETKPEPETKSEVEPVIEEFAEQSLGFSTDEVEKEEASEFQPAMKPEEQAKPEMPLQRDTMALTKLEADLVDKYGFTPDQICNKLKEMFGEDELTKLTKEQTRKATEYFEKTIESLEEAKNKQ